MVHDEEHFKLYAGLKALTETSFPKKCASCGRVYPTAKDFIRHTRSIRNGVSGLKSARDESDQSVIELFRNCPCGSTLMDFFGDRRDATAEGVERRRLFDNLMGMLMQKGIVEEVARTELLKILQGEQSPLLAGMGIKMHSG